MTPTLWGPASPWPLYVLYFKYNRTHPKNKCRPAPSASAFNEGCLVDVVKVVLVSMSSNVVSPSLTMRQSKLECFYTLYVFQDNLTCSGKAGAYLKVLANITLSNKLAQDNTLTYFTRSFQNLHRTKHSCLFLQEPSGVEHFMVPF